MEEEVKKEIESTKVKWWEHIMLFILRMFFVLCFLAAVVCIYYLTQGVWE